MKLANQLFLLIEQFISLPNSLGFKRDEMPQIPTAKFDEFLAYLKESGCDYEHTKKKAEELTPSQAELDTDKADRIWAEGKAFSSPIVTSLDGYVLDGHHRWFAVKRNAPEKEMDCIMLSNNAKPSLELMHNFDHAKVVDLNDKKVKLSEKVKRFFGKTA